LWFKTSDWLILFGDSSLRRAEHEFIAHFHSERNHQGKGNLSSLLWRRQPLTEVSAAPNDLAVYFDTTHGRLDSLTIRDYATFLAATFFWGIFFEATSFHAAFLFAHRFFKAATIAALPAVLSLRLRFVG
jgi:hypothetical protein